MYPEMWWMRDCENISLDMSGVSSCNLELEEVGLLKTKHGSYNPEIQIYVHNFLFCYHYVVNIENLVSKPQNTFHINS